MCMLCAQSLFVDAHWTDRDPDASEPTAMAGDDRERRRRRDWHRRAQLLNRVLSCYGLSLDNWQNRHYVLSDRKGRSEMVTDLGALWPAAAQLLGRPLDPPRSPVHRGVAPRGPGAMRRSDHEPRAQTSRHGRYPAFLGSGKTTLLRHVLAGQGAHGTAVLVNEFGEVGLDHHLVRQLDEQTILLNNGCVCCSVRDDLVQALSSLLDQEERGAIVPIDRVILETTGLADPAPILFTIETDPMLRHHFRVERVVVTVDAMHGERHLDRQAVSLKQVAAADDLIVTKTDLAPPEGRRRSHGAPAGPKPHSRARRRRFRRCGARASFSAASPSYVHRAANAPCP